MGRPIFSGNKEICEKRGAHRVDMSAPYLQLLMNPPIPIRHCVDCGAQVKLKINSPQRIFAEVLIECPDQRI